MAWIKAMERKHVGRVLIDMVRVYVDGKQVTGVDGSSNPMVVILGTYDTPVIANTVKDDIEAWLKAGGKGLFTMPSEAEICGERSQDDAMPFHFYGGSWNNFWIDLPKHIKECFVSVPGGIEAYERDGNSHCFYLRVCCPGCGREGLNVSGLCPSCWESKTVQDVKVFPAHDASKPIYGAFTTEPGDIIEVLVGGETLTCKVTKTVRKTPHGTFTVRLVE